MAALAPPDEGLVLVGIVARPHGLRGQVIVNPETDFADERFAPGATVLALVEGRLAPLTVTSLRFHQGRPIVAFEGRTTIEAVERLAGEALWIREGERSPLEPGRFYHSDLVGCRVETRDGRIVGTVARVSDEGGGPLLAVGAPDGEEVLVPLSEAICPVIDIAARRIVVEPPEGLLELNRASTGKSGGRGL
jgi:16S rRNA processing protein RimM